MRIIANVVNGILQGILAIAVLVALILFVPKVGGIMPMAVLSGSMEPVYPTGSLLYVKAVEPEELTTGMAVTYELTDRVMVTHRIVSIDKYAHTLVTKGDANQGTDGKPIAFSQVRGCPIFCIPYLGYVAEYLNRTSGKIVTLCAIAGCVLAMILLDMVSTAKKKNWKQIKGGEAG